MTNTTSRDTIIDSIEFLSNQIALASHCQELIHNYISEINLEATTDTQKDELIKKIDQQKSILESAIDMRRNFTKKLFNSISGWDHKMRCSFKHAVASYWYSVELRYANMWDFDYEVMCQNAYEQLISVASLFFWLDDIVTCWRCLVDQLKEIDKQIDLHNNEK